VVTLISRLILLTILGLCTAIFVIRAANQNQIEPAFVIFTNPDGTRCHDACLFGVYPGQQTFDEALATLKNHPFTRDMQIGFYRDGMWFKGKGALISIIRREENRVNSIRLQHQNKLYLPPDETYPLIDLMLGETISVLGIPDKLTVTTRTVSSYYYVNRMVITTSLSHTRHSVDSSEHVDSITVFAPDTAFAVTAASRWNGFANSRLYLGQ
jgi:hypothetical protein